MTEPLDLDAIKALEQAVTPKLRQIASDFADWLEALLPKEG